ncbi:hypothetical protein ACWC0C_07110 [Streptomyces sp. NPDC001709]
MSIPTATPPVPAGTTARPARPALDVTDPGEAVWSLWAHMGASGDWYRQGGRAWRLDPATGQPRPATAKEVKTWAALRLQPGKETSNGTSARTVPGVLAEMALEPQPGTLPEITGIRTHLFLRPDGTLAQGAGHDAVSGYWIAPAVDHMPVSEEPTAAELDEARTVIADLMAGWTFTAASDAAGMLAMLCDPVIRLYAGSLAPGVMITASSPSSGKSYGAEVMTRAFGGRMVSAATSAYMLGRQLTTTMQQAGYLSVLCLDNMPNGGTLDHPGVSSLLTAERFTERAVCTGSQVDLAGIDRPMIACTGNAASLGGDNASRFLVVRLGDRTPHTRAYDDAAVAWALGTLARGWVLAGAPLGADDIAMRQFTPWVRAAAGLTEWIGYPGLWQERDAVLADMDQEGADWAHLGEAAHALHATVKEKTGREWLTASEIVKECQDLIPRPGAAERPERADRRIGHRAFGLIIKARLGRIDGGYRWERRWNSTDHKWLYRVVRVARGAAAGLRERAAAVLDAVRMAARPAVPGAVLSAPVPAVDLFGTLGAVGPDDGAPGMRVGIRPQV